MSESVDCVVIGAGVVGLAAARCLAQRGREVLVLEAEPRVGAHTSSRNSEVIHAGIYYPRASLKATLCVAGKQALYRYCRAKGVPHERLGKLIVANGETEVERLSDILRRGRANGVADLEWLDAAGAAELEPGVRADAAILSPSTGIVDSHALMLALQGDLEAAGGTILCRHEVKGLAASDGGLRLDCRAEQSFSVNSGTVVNSAGLWASALALKTRGLDASRVPETRFAKGHYFDYGASPFRRLVYPVPIVGGLGIHATNDLAGRARFGPDADWIETIDYAFDGARREAFVAAVSRYFPALDAERLSPAYTGIRPKLYRPGEPPADFVIQGPRQHGVAGLVNLFGIESPGLTSCLAIAERVAAELA